MQTDEELAQIYHAIAASLTTGLVRFGEGRLLFDQLVRMLVLVNTDASASDGRGLLTLRSDYRSFDNWYYLSSAGLMVYSTTLLDTFLSDSATFLYTRYPKALGNDLKIPITEIVSAESKFSLINQGVEKRVRALGFETFATRLNSLDRVFGLKVTLNDKEQELLAECSEIRNAFIHDQSLFRIFLDETGGVKVQGKTCLRHPRPITREMGNAAIRLQAKICGSLYGGVIRGILKVDASEFVRTEAWIQSIGEKLSDITDLRTNPDGALDARGLDEDLEVKWVPLTSAKKRSV
jgi:hypothetical protein